MKKTPYTLALLIFLSIVSFKATCQNQAALRHDFVKRENSSNEMAVGNYTILATATSEASANQIVQEIQKSGYTDVGFGYLSVKKSWYIYVTSGKEIEKAQAIRDRYRKIERFKDAWILTVHE